MISNSARRSQVIGVSGELQHCAALPPDVRQVAALPPQCGFAA
jgi:hypothetical protein